MHVLVSALLLFRNGTWIPEQFTGTESASKPNLIKTDTSWNFAFMKADTNPSFMSTISHGDFRGHCEIDRKELYFTCPL